MHEQELTKALEFIKSKHNGEIPYSYGSMECAKLMMYYASLQCAEMKKDLQSKKETIAIQMGQIDKAQKRIEELEQSLNLLRMGIDGATDLNQLEP